MVKWAMGVVVLGLAFGAALYSTYKAIDKALRSGW